MSASWTTTTQDYGISNPAQLQDVDLNNIEAVESGGEQVCPSVEGFSRSSTDSSQAKETEEKPEPPTGCSACSAKWTHFIVHYFHRPILAFVHLLTNTAAKWPRPTMSFVFVFSVALLMLGMVTNFTVDVDGDRLWVPADSRPVEHMTWIEDVSGFPESPRSIVFFFHAQGDSVLTHDAVEHVFVALDSVRGLPDYDTVCAQGNDDNKDGEEQEERGCKVRGVTEFWNHSVSIFEEEVTSDEETVTAVSASTYPDGTPVSRHQILGYPTVVATSNNATTEDELPPLSAVMSYFVLIEMPTSDDVKDFEEEALDVILDLDDAWNRDASTRLRVEIIAERSFDDEFERAIVNDIPLLPMAFVIMSVFCVIIFSKRDKVRSHSLVGFGAVMSVMLSIFTGYGLMWLCGVPFTSMTQILPFVLFGVGLDDAFILSGSYSRTDPGKDVRSRIYDMTQDVGVSITITTITSTTAFGLGCISTVPAVFWLCLYAFPTLVLIYLYQLTFFVACMVVDERRIQQNRRDCCIWITVQDGSGDNDDDENGQSQKEETVSSSHRMSPVDRFMHGYANFLLRPWVKVLVVLAFAGLAVGCGYSASQLTQEFAVRDVLPDDSYVADFLDATSIYTARSPIDPYAYFRYVDQSDPAVWTQMENYVNQLVQIDAIPLGPDRFWLEDFQKFVNRTDGLSELSFNEQIGFFLNDTVNGQLYGEDIVRDENGTITASRVMLNMDNVDIEDIKQQIDALKDQRAVTEAQPINQGRDNWVFFTYDENYNIWTFYAASADELIMTTVYGVSAVTIVAFLLIPHWSAALFVLPLISVLYLDLLGVLQWAGLHVDPVSYVSLVMSIGLLVDFIMHILLRFYESSGNRHEKTVETLTTMGSSILIGAISTFLGTLPLAFSSSTIFNTVFYAFLGLVTLGAGHGLILLPVILSTIGPEDQVKPSRETDDDKLERRGTAVTENA